MQGAIARFCVVVAAAILNHPLLFPDNSTAPDPKQENDLLVRMKEHQERLEAEQAQLEQELSAEALDAGLYDNFSWYFWSTFSLVIFFIIEVCRQEASQVGCQGSNAPSEDEESWFGVGCASGRGLVLEKGALRGFCEKCFHGPTHESRKLREFVEGFADDLLEALRSVGDREADMEVEDFVGVGSVFESWGVCRPFTCDLIVPFALPEPYGYQFKLWCGPSSDLTPDLWQGCGQIRLARLGEDSTSCLCGCTNLGEDMLCLVHARNDPPKDDDHCLEELLCSKGTTNLAKDQVMKWFQISVTKAWGRISHKYEFELTFRNLDSPGALKIRFRSGKVVLLNLTPVVQLEDTDAYFISHFPTDSESSSDTHWHLSFCVYERNLLKLLAKSLPENSCHIRCLQVASFLHKKQTSLTGRCALTNYHLKTALLHLSLAKPPSAWGPQNLDQRFEDLLGFLQKSVQEKRLSHIIIGNSSVPAEIRVPDIFQAAEPVNLFRPLVLQRQLYSGMVQHVQEMVRNAPVLIQEYTPHIPNGDVPHGPHSELQS
ncbi:inositol 1,4,5-trisphosphate receptor-interacting protein [Clupea harengus]|uniref:Inositol 1,4,5-trisphosphate receptor-interacting protein n=1 Tax=Clupea harengus TaxID=7950 RepID=A0A6P3VW11_CLUHA|nr:inositol 1,4,5-trisphosphate receptor-interacting protein [Clupea harengus]